MSLNSMARDIKDYDSHKDAPVWIYSRDVGPISVDHYLTLAEAERFHRALGRTIEVAREKDAARIEAEREAAEFAAFKASKVAEARQAMIDEEIANCSGCGGREFPRDPNCQSCTDAVDEELARQKVAA